MTAVGTGTDQKLDEVKHLTSCLNDLISVLALPAMWSGGEPCQVVTALLDFLLGILRLDFAYAEIKDSFNNNGIEMVRFAQSGSAAAEAHEIGVRN